MPVSQWSTRPGTVPASMLCVVEHFPSYYHLSLHISDPRNTVYSQLSSLIHALPAFCDALRQRLCIVVCSMCDDVSLRH